MEKVTDLFLNVALVFLIFNGALSETHLQQPTRHLNDAARKLLTSDDLVSIVKVNPLVERTYIFSNANWWETPDHQLTTTITLLALGFNISAITVLPDLVGPDVTRKNTRYSLLGDFYDMKEVQKVQKATTVTKFMESPDYQLLHALAESQERNHLSFPKSSQATYEASLKVFSSIGTGGVDFGMPHVDLESTGQFCSNIPGTVQVSQDGKVRFVFLERIHFYYVCTEAYMPWWYDVRMHIVPREEYRTLAARFQENLPLPLTVIHVRDSLSGVANRTDDDIFGYARQITDGLRRVDRLEHGAVYFEYSVNSASAAEIAELFREEFAVVKKCLDLYVCGHLVRATEFKPSLEPAVHRTLFETKFGASLIAQALAMKADHFIGNIYSPYSRNIALYRKLHGMTYELLKGFAEMKKIDRWRL